MAATKVSVDKAADLLARMQALIALREQVKATFADNKDAPIKPEIRQTLRDDWDASYQALNDSVVAEIRSGGW